MKAYHAPPSKDFVEVRESSSYEILGFIRRPCPRPNSDRLEVPIRPTLFAATPLCEEHALSLSAPANTRVRLMRQTFHHSYGSKRQGGYDAYFVSKQEWDRLNPEEFVL
jgi:hypothetical protein